MKLSIDFSSTINPVESRVSHSDKSCDLEKGPSSTHSQKSYVITSITLKDKRSTEKDHEEFEHFNTGPDNEGHARFPSRSRAKKKMSGNDFPELMKTQTGFKEKKLSHRETILRDALKRGVSDHTRKDDIFLIGVSPSASAKGSDTMDHLLSFRSEKEQHVFPKREKQFLKTEEVLHHREITFVTVDMKDTQDEGHKEFCYNETEHKEEKIELKEMVPLICEICFEQMEPKAMPLLKCRHVFCSDCYTTYLKEKLNFDTILDIKCPKDGCTKEFEAHHIQNLLGETLFEKYKKFRRVALLSRKPNLRWCVRPGCGKFVIGKKGAETVKCECGTEICFKCGSGYHPGKSCEQVLDGEYKKFAEQNNIHTCPYCKSRIEKFDGCNHMTCPICAYEWCWLCGKEYTPMHFSVANPEACSKLAKADKTAYAKHTFKSYSLRVLETLLFVVFFPVLLLVLAIKMPSWQYDRYLERKHGPNYDSEEEEDCLFRLFLFFVGIILSPVTLIYLAIYRFILVCKYIWKFLAKRKAAKEKAKQEQKEPEP